MKRLLPVALELIGIAAIGGGIGIELATGGHAGFILITGGSCFIAIGAIIWGKFIRKRCG